MGLISLCNSIPSAHVSESAVKVENRSMCAEVYRSDSASIPQQTIPHQNPLEAHRAISTGAPTCNKSRAAFLESRGLQNWNVIELFIAWECCCFGMYANYCQGLRPPKWESNKVIKNSDRNWSDFFPFFISFFIFYFPSNCHPRVRNRDVRETLRLLAPYWLKRPKLKTE